MGENVGRVSSNGRLVFDPVGDEVPAPGIFVTL